MLFTYKTASTQQKFFIKLCYLHKIFQIFKTNTASTQEFYKSIWIHLLVSAESEKQKKNGERIGGINRFSLIPISSSKFPS